MTPPSRPPEVSKVITQLDGMLDVVAKITFASSGDVKTVPMLQGLTRRLENLRAALSARPPAPSPPYGFSVDRALAHLDTAIENMPLLGERVERPSGSANGGKVITRMGDLCWHRDHLGKLLAVVRTALDSRPPAPAEAAEQDLRPEVLAFAHLMEAQLRKHDATRGPTGWKRDPAGELLAHAEEEWREFNAEVQAWGSPIRPMNAPRIAKEAADLANMAMMIVDVTGGLLASSPPVPGAPDDRNE